MAVIVVANETVAKTFMNQFPILPSIEGAGGPIALGTANVEEGVAPRRVAWKQAYPKPVVHWILSVAERKGISDKVQVLDELPSDWRHPQGG